MMHFPKLKRPDPKPVAVATTPIVDESTHDEDGRLIMTAPLPAPERPKPTVLRLGPPRSSPRAPAPAPTSGLPRIRPPANAATKPPTLPPVSPNFKPSQFVRDYLGRVVVPTPPPERYVEHRGYMGRMDLIDPDDIPY